MKTNLPKKALVIGGSMAGLLTARVLSDHFDLVTLVERDQMQDLPESRKVSRKPGTFMACWPGVFR